MNEPTELKRRYRLTLVIEDQEDTEESNGNASIAWTPEVWGSWGGAGEGWRDLTPEDEPQDTGCMVLGALLMGTLKRFEEERQAAKKAGRKVEIAQKIPGMRAKKNLRRVRRGK